MSLVFRKEMGRAVSEEREEGQQIGKSANVIQDEVRSAPSPV